MEEKVKYYLKWKDTTVGVVYTNDNNEYKYIPDIENIRKLSKEGMPATLVIMPQREWKKTMPQFIQKRLKLNVKDNNKVVTDYFSIEECEERTER